MTTAVGRAFDAIAETYDAQFTASRAGMAQRQAVWRLLDRVFPPGARVLEINCGTGVDAAHLAARGVRMHACDISRGMLDIARERLHGIEGVEVERRSTEDLAGLPGPYDGLLSNFGGINCVHNLSRALAPAKRLVRVGGNVILCYMGPACAWEVLWYLAQRRPRKAFRRWKRSAVTTAFGDEYFHVHYPRVKDIVRYLAPNFRLAGRWGVGVFVPPSYAEGFAIHHPRSLDIAMRLDRVVGSWPLFRSMGDHVLLHFKKVYE